MQLFLQVERTGKSPALNLALRRVESNLTSTWIIFKSSRHSYSRTWYCSIFVWFSLMKMKTTLKHLLVCANKSIVNPSSFSYCIHTLFNSSSCDLFYSPNESRIFSSDHLLPVFTELGMTWPQILIYTWEFTVVGMTCHLWHGMLQLWLNS